MTAGRWRRVWWRDELTGVRRAVAVLALIVAAFGVVILLNHQQLLGRHHGDSEPAATPTATPAQPGPTFTPAPTRPPAGPTRPATVVIRDGGTTVIVTPAQGPSSASTSSRPPSSPAGTRTPSPAPTRCLVHNPLTGECTPI